MTREERKLALYCLKAYSDYHSEVCEECINYPNCDHTQQDDIGETIIKELEKESCEDAISRHDVECIVEELENICHNAPQEVLELLAKLKNAPSVMPQTKSGHWIKQKYRRLLPRDVWAEYSVFGAHPDEEYNDEEGSVSDYKTVCSQCGYEINELMTKNYCPNCGAKMESEVQNNV